jgi:hypothetical protein
MQWVDNSYPCLIIDPPLLEVVGGHVVIPFLPGYDDIAEEHEMLESPTGTMGMHLVMAGWICQGMTSGAANWVRRT